MGSLPNSYYNLINRNCTQVTMHLFSLGVLPDGTNVGDYMKDNNVKISVLPNTNMKNMQRIFYNNATKLSGFYSGIDSKLKEYNEFDTKTRNAYAKRITNIKRII